MGKALTTDVGVRYILTDNFNISTGKTGISYASTFFAILRNFQNREKNAEISSSREIESSLLRSFVCLLLSGRSYLDGWSVIMSKTLC